VRQISEERVRALAMVAIEDAAHQTFTTQYSHSDFVNISRDDDGEIVLMQANTMLMNSLVRLTSERARQNLAYIEKDGIPVPIGAFFGLALFAGVGPDVNLQVVSVGVMGTDIHSEFMSAGINQTLHRITLILSAEVTLIMPGLSSRLNVAIPVPIIESTVIGRVPDVFLQSDMFGRSLNLVP